jgi:hypothetical protein
MQMVSSDSNDAKMREVAKALSDHRGRENWKDSADSWGIEGHGDNELPIAKANLFLLRCLIDYQCNSADAWKRGEVYFDEKLNSDQRRELWKTIAETPQEEWNSEENFDRCNLHRWHRAHNRLWPIADCICRYFEGDARNIWRKGSSTFDVLCRLYYIGAGEQLSRMIVGALKDCSQISGASDVKADVHVCRVLGRVFFGKEAIPGAAIKLSRDLYPDDPWQLDGPLWNLGQGNCSDKSPQCAGCYLKSNCRYEQERS